MQYPLKYDNIMPKGNVNMNDTICAISTSLGVGAISIIRVSGNKAIEIVSKLFKGANLFNAKSHTIHYGFIYNKKEKIDEVLVSIMLAPKTYTTEDIVEINLHGGINTTTKVLELLLENGCRIAEPGEFTKRAFLNGRIDLTQAESVNDLINAKSDMARKMALNNLDGNLNQEIKKIRHEVVDIMSNIEVNIDYPEYEDIEIVTTEILLPKLTNIVASIKRLLNDSKNCQLVKDGINIAIVGKPNVGKSSILNFLLNEEKAIVTDIPGTTRDIVEGSITLNGFLINFIDTAGIRDTEDVVEKIGVEKSKKAMEKADLIIIVLNNNESLTDYDKELMETVPKEKRIIFINKSDLKQRLELPDHCIIGNTVNRDGLDKLKDGIIKKLQLEEILNKDMTYVSNLRQIDLLKKAKNSLENAIANLENSMPIDIVEIDIMNAWNFLGEITGETYKDELLNALFSNFCLGK